MAQDALATLYEVSPGTGGAVERAAGCAAFSTFAVKLFFAGGTTGNGMVVNQRTQCQTFMKMVRVQGGLGFGANQNRLILVVTTERALRNFIDQGREFGGQAISPLWSAARAVSSAVPLRCLPRSTFTN